MIGRVYHVLLIWEKKVRRTLEQGNTIAAMASDRPKVTESSVRPYLGAIIDIQANIEGQV